MTDMINPAHYRGDRKFEPIDVIDDWNLNYRLGNALKYISRNGRKPGEDPREGLRKAIWYLERQIQALDKPSQYAPPADVQYEDVLRPAGDIRIYELAHELGLSNREVLDACDSLGINVKGHSSSLCAAAASKLRGFLRNRGVEYEDVIKYYKSTKELHEDVLDYYGQSVDLDEAWPEYHSPTPTVKGDDGIIGGSGDDTLQMWEETPDYVTGWDQSLGPVEISSEEVKYMLSLKDTNQFDEDEIVSIIERRGMIIGFRKDGTSCVLKDGRCE